MTVTVKRSSAQAKPQARLRRALRLGDIRKSRQSEGAFLAAHGQQPAEHSDDAAERITWRLATEVPDYWIPFVPVQKKAGEAAIVFRRGSTLRLNGSRQPQSARSHILRPDPDQLLDLYEEELPREGLRVTRGYQYTRWLDDLSFLWVGRRKQPGRGEGASGLQFDVAEKND